MQRSNSRLWGLLVRVGRTTSFARVLRVASLLQIHGEVISWFFGEFRASWKKVGSYNLACLNGQSTFKTDTSTT